jgi:hypothetical protein
MWNGEALASLPVLLLGAAEATCIEASGKLTQYKYFISLDKPR